MTKRLKYPRQLWILAIGLMINVTGTSFLWPLTTIYIGEVLGRSVTVAGFVLMCQAGAGMIGSLLGGTLYDRIGGRKAIVIGTSLATLSVFTIAFVHIWSIYIAMMILLGFSTGIIFPAVYAMAGGVWPEGGQKAFNLMYVSQNIGVALGSALGGIVAQYSFTFTFMVNGFTYILFSLLVWFGLSHYVAIQPRGVTSSDKHDRSNEERVNERRGFIALILLGIGFMACWITYVQWQTSISKYMTDMGYSLSQYSLVWTINGALIILIQPFSSVVIRRLIPNIKQQLIVGVSIFILAFLMLSRQEHYYGFLVGMGIMTLGEIFIWPGVPAAAAQLAPVGRKGFYQGVVNSFSTGGRMLGPLIGGLLYDHFNAQVMLYGMMGICMFALLSYLSYDRFLVKRNKKQYVSIHL